METEVIHADPEEGDVYMEGANEVCHSLNGKLTLSNSSLCEYSY